jgi:hypothetical protein
VNMDQEVRGSSQPVPEDSGMRKVLRVIFSRENVWALVLCLILVLVIIFTAGSAPLWIYQGF